MKIKNIKLLSIFLVLILLTFACKKEETNNETFIIKLKITPETGTVDTEFTFNAEGSTYRSFSSFFDVELFSWDFDYTGIEDLFYDIERSPNPIQTHSYDSPGTYEVLLLAHGTDESQSTTRTIIVSDTLVSNTPGPDTLTAAFEVWPPSGYPNINIFAFTNASYDLFDPQESLELRWDWENDGIFDTEFSTEQSTIHRFTSPGDYEVKLEVKNSLGMLADTINVVEIFGPGGSPCSGSITVEYGGKTYNTVQIGSQCWLSENLDIGTMIPDNTLPTQNSPNEIIEKYCYYNNEDTCAKYGGLYNWNEMMQYVQDEGTKGICPEGWHIPTDIEWMILEGEIDSQYDYPEDSTYWAQYGHIRGSDLGINIRSQSYWYNLGMGYDKFGFNAQPGGQRKTSNGFKDLGLVGYYWTSTSMLSGNARWINPGNKVTRWLDQKEYGYCVRCIRDE